MKPVKLLAHDAARLKALASYNLLDTPPEELYDHITCIACELSGTPMAFIALVDESREWIKAGQGLGIVEAPLEYSFCAHAMLTPTEIMVVPDARSDERFFDNPLTTGDPQIIFYAGAPLVDAQGYPLGALAVADTRPRELPEQKLLILKAMASLVCANFEMRRMRMQLDLLQGMQAAVPTSIKN